MAMDDALYTNKHDDMILKRMYSILHISVLITIGFRLSIKSHSGVRYIIQEKNSCTGVAMGFLRAEFSQ